MTKKDYELIASTFSRVKTKLGNDERFTPEQVFRIVEDQLCVKFYNDNPRFDSVKFSNACKGK